MDNPTYNFFGYISTLYQNIAISFYVFSPVFNFVLCLLKGTAVSAGTKGEQRGTVCRFFFVERDFELEPEGVGKDLLQNGAAANSIA